MIDTLDCISFLITNKNTFVYLLPDHPYKYDNAYSQLINECPSFSKDPIHNETYVYKELKGKKVEYNSLLQFIAGSDDESLSYPYKVNGKTYKTNLVNIYMSNKKDFVELITRVLSHYPKMFERKPFYELDNPTFSQPPIKLTFEHGEKYREHFDKLAIKHMKGGKK